MGDAEIEQRVAALEERVSREGPAALGEAVTSDWVRLMSGAKSREERKAINERFRTLATQIDSIYAVAAGEVKPSPFAKFVPPPLPFDPLGRVVYRRLTAPRMPKKDACGLCSAMEYIDHLEDVQCKDTKEPGRCVAEGIGLMQRLLLHMVTQEEFLDELKAFCERWSIPLEAGA